MRLILGVGLAVILAGLTHAETARWQSDRTLWCSAVTLAPEKPRALNNCALALLHTGDYFEALPLLDRAAFELERREPNRRGALRATVLTNRFLVLYALRREDEARETLEQIRDHHDPRVVRFQRWLQIPQTRQP